jgi:hypothetical protein
MVPFEHEKRPWVKRAGEFCLSVGGGGGGGSDYKLEHVAGKHMKCCTFAIRVCPRDFSPASQNRWLSAAVFSKL